MLLHEYGVHVVVLLVLVGIVVGCFMPEILRGLKCQWGQDTDFSGA